jgi:hypothetical protein
LTVRGRALAPSVVEAAVSEREEKAVHRELHALRPGGSPLQPIIVAEDEVEAILRAPGEDRRGNEYSRVAIGRTPRAGISGVYVRDPEPDNVFVITAYELRAKPLLAYIRRKRKKRR